MRTDENNNPTAFITLLAEQAGLTLNVDYVPGTPFTDGSGFVTAKLLADPVSTTIRLIEAVGFYNHSGGLRWLYVAMPRYAWAAMSSIEKRDCIGGMYYHEGGTAMRNLFPNWGPLK